MSMKSSGLHPGRARRHRKGASVGSPRAAIPFGFENPNRRVRGSAMMNRRRVGARAEPARVAVRRDGDVRKRAARTTRGDARFGKRRARASQQRVLGACVEMCLVLGVFLGIGSLAAAVSNPTVRLTARKRASDTEAL
jgi:hypothetical protein